MSPTSVRLARQLSGSRDDLLDLATAVAEAQVDLTRVRRIRTELINRALHNPDFQSATDSMPSIQVLGRFLSAHSGRLGPTDVSELAVQAPERARAPR